MHISTHTNVSAKCSAQCTYETKHYHFFTGALNLTHEEFHTLIAPTAITNVGCIGIESKLTECSHSTSTSCDLLNDAGVVCQGKARDRSLLCFCMCMHILDIALSTFAIKPS